MKPPNPDSLNKINESISQAGLSRSDLFHGEAVRRTHVMVKTIGSMCNLDCTYCYYLSKAELLGTPRHWAMSGVRRYYRHQSVSPRR